MRRKQAEKWIQDAIKRPGALHDELGIPEDKNIPMSTINSEIDKLEDKAEGEKTLPKDELRELRQLNLAKTLKGLHKKSSIIEDTIKVAYANPGVRSELLAVILKYL